jgi:hypothetical protein
LNRVLLGLTGVALAITVVACGADDGGVPAPEKEKVQTEFHDGATGTDVQDIETYDANVQVQAIVVDGVKCILAVRGGDSANGMDLECP